MSSGASDAAEALQAAAKAAFQSAFDAGSAFGRSHSAVRQASDLVDVMARVIDMVVAAKALHDAAEIVVRDLRAVLSAQMQETGAVKIEATHDTAHLARLPAFLNITDRALIPQDYYVQPPPKLDESAVKSALKDGVLVPGVTLVTRNDMSLVIKPKKEQA